MADPARSGREVVSNAGEYLTEEFTREALAHIDNATTQPFFFLCLAAQLRRTQPLQT